MILFLLEHEIYGVAVQSIQQNCKKWFCEELLIENNVQAVLGFFCCYDHGPKTSEAVQKIATNAPHVL